MTSKSDQSPCVMVSGADGFIGRHLCPALEQAGYRLRPVTRKDSGGDSIRIGDIGSETDWSEALKGVDYVIHLAARVHILHETQTDSLAAFRAVNVAGTERLALSADQAGIQRLIYISSVKVNGERTMFGEPGFTEADQPAPEDPYGISKWEAEQTLMRVNTETGLEYVIVRPPLVYGPYVKGNFYTMLNWVYRGIPLPLAHVANQRSLVGIENLTHFVIHCLQHPNAANQSFLVSDDNDLSTSELIQHLAQALGRQSLLFPFPEAVLRRLARIAGREAMLDRLYGSLQVDISKAHEQLGWHPPVSVDDGLLKTAQWYLEQRHSG